MELTFPSHPHNCATKPAPTFLVTPRSRGTPPQNHVPETGTTTCKRTPLLCPRPPLPNCTTRISGDGRHSSFVVMVVSVIAALLGPHPIRRESLWWAASTRRLLCCTWFPGGGGGLAHWYFRFDALGCPQWRYVIVGKSVCWDRGGGGLLEGAAVLGVRAGCLPHCSHLQHPAPLP